MRSPKMILKGFGMNTSAIKGKKVTFSNDLLIVELQDGRTIGTPMSWYKPLQEASINEISDYKFIYKQSNLRKIKESNLNQAQSELEPALIKAKILIISQMAQQI